MIGGKIGIPIGGRTITNLHFADDNEALVDEEQ